MGIFDSIFGGKRREPAGSGPGQERIPTATVPVVKPFAITAKFSSLRLRAQRNSKIFLEVGVTNISSTKQLVSVDLNLPMNSKIGFDVTCNQNYVEKRLGEIMPGGEAKFTVPVYGSALTKDGSYTVEINAFSHYLDYRKVLSQMRKKISLRVVAGP